jgi:LmbE family N-acetylglucosaminyl deacetylase
MKLKNPNAQIFIPDGTDEEQAMAKITHMAIGAHQDDVEIMAYDGIIKCFGSKENHFMAVIATDGAGSARSGIYADYTDDDMKKIRKVEQKKAAVIGEYTALAMLDYPSREAKDSGNSDMAEEIANLISAARPQVLYTHNPTDKHDTHVAVVLKTIKAIRSLPKDARPKKVYGCEGWRSLDWLMDGDKVMFDVDRFPNLAAALVEVFDSQITGGKRYDRAEMGRRLANATYAASHATDTSQAMTYAMDLTPLIDDDALDIKEYALGYVERLLQDVESRIDKLI